MTPAGTITKSRKNFPTMSYRAASTMLPIPLASFSPDFKASKVRNHMSLTQFAFILESILPHGFFTVKTFWLWKSHVVKLIQEWKQIGSGTYDFSLLTLWNPAKRRPTEWEASSKPPYMTLSGSFFCFSWSCLRGSSFWDMWSTWSRRSFRNCEKSKTIYVESLRPSRDAGSF